nr:hypothetical protein [Bifidobacterium dentium]
MIVTRGGISGQYWFNENGDGIRQDTEIDNPTCSEYRTIAL